jgi:plasmid replication initiation protein
VTNLKRLRLSAYKYSWADATALSSAANVFPHFKLKEMSTRAELIEERLQHLIEDMRDRQGRRNSLDLVQDFKEKIHAIDEEYQDAAIHERDGSIAPGQVRKSTPNTQTTQ